MAQLNEIQLRWLRDEVGSSVPDDTLQGRYDDLGSVRDVALSVLRDRRAKLLDSPLSVSVSGVASINNTENVRALERRMAALTKLDDDPTDEPGEDVEGGAVVLEPIQLVRSRRR
jgi:hypothetical protein